MTEQTDAAEVDVRDTLLAALNDEYGDQGWDELRSLSRIVRIIAAREAAARAEALRGILFRVETACDGYSHLMDEDVPSDVTDLAAYEQGAHDAAEAIRAIARTDGAGS